MIGKDRLAVISMNKVTPFEDYWSTQQEPKGSYTVVICRDEFAQGCT